MKLMILFKRFTSFDILVQSLTLVCALASNLLTSTTSFGFTYVALGDSISAGTNAEEQSLHSPYAWTVGAKLERNFVRAMGKGLERYHNAAVPGSLSAMLHVQSYVAEWMQARYVSITIGGNDFAWGKGHEVLPNVRKIVERLSAHDYVRRIFISTIPDLEQIYQLGNSDAYCRAFHVLAPLFLMAPDNQRRDVAAQIHEANDHIKALADEYPKLTVVTAVSDRPYQNGDISHIDCIHPSRQGQQQLADAFIEAFQETESN